MIHGWHLAFPRMHFGIMDGYPYFLPLKSAFPMNHQRENIWTHFIFAFFPMQKQHFLDRFWVVSVFILAHTFRWPRWPRGRGRPGAWLRLGWPAAGGGLRGRRRGAAAAGAASVAGGRGDAGWKLDDWVDGLMNLDEKWLGNFAIPWESDENWWTLMKYVLRQLTLW